MSEISFTSAASHVHAIALALSAAGIAWAAVLAGLSRWHWSFRVGLLCLPLVLLLPIRAYEPLVLLFPLVIALAASAAALRGAWEKNLGIAARFSAAADSPATDQPRQTSTRFHLSLLDALLGITVIGVTLGLLVQLPWRSLNISWTGLVFDGVLMYCISVVCLALIGLRGGLAWAVALFLCVSTGIVFESTFGDGLRALYLLGVAGPQHLTWFPLLEFYLVLVTVLLIGLWLVRWCWAVIDQPLLLAQRRRMVGSLATVAAAPAVVLYMAMFVGPPAVHAPKIRNNSLPQLVEIAQRLENLGLGDMTIEEVQRTYPQASYDQQVEQLYQQSLHLVKQPGSVSLDGSVQANEQSLAVQETQLGQIRTLARRWSREADYSARNGDIRRAVDFDLAILRIGNYLASGGIRVHVHAGLAIKNDGLAHLSMLRERLPVDLIPKIIDVLQLLDVGEEDPQLTLARDRYWTDIAQGWRNRLEIVVHHVLRVPSVETVTFQALQQPLRREAALRRLLITNLALRWHHDDQGEYPRSLVELVPLRLERMPRDPYTQVALIYKPAQFGYLLYSTGPDAHDDGGNFARFGGEHHTFAGHDWNLESVIRFGWRGWRGGGQAPGFNRPGPRQPGNWTMPPLDNGVRRFDRPDMVRRVSGEGLH